MGETHPGVFPSHPSPFGTCTHVHVCPHTCKHRHTQGMLFTTHTHAHMHIQSAGWVGFVCEHCVCGTELVGDLLQLHQPH